MHTTQHWKKWQGKVLGSESDIKQALKILKRDPKTIDELQAIIIKIRKQEVEKTLKDSIENSTYDLPD